MPSSTPDQNPLLSIVVIVYDMAAPAMNTLRSLTAAYQRIPPHLYEIIVVENRSGNMLDPSEVAALGNQFRYFDRNESSASPVFAANFGLSRCRGRYIGMMIDGARLLTAEILQNVLRCFRAHPQALCLVPGYELRRPGQTNANANENRQVEEQHWLNNIDWLHDSYQLFSHATPSPGNKNGYLNPFMECNCLFATRRSFEAIGGIDRRFTLPGGGSVNLHLLRQIGILPGVQPVVLAGEGSFHQYHGGVTTSERQDRAALIAQFKQQLDQAWQGKFHALRKQPLLLGKIGPAALPAFQHSCEQSINRFRKLRNEQRADWEDDEGLSDNSPRPENSPTLSIVIAACQLPRQLDDTLYSLSTKYQRGVRGEDYEIIVVEYDSTGVPGGPALDMPDTRCRYYRLDSGMNTLRAAIDVGLARARGDYIGLVENCTTIFTPGVIRHTLDCLKAFTSPSVVVPRYQLSLLATRPAVRQPMARTMNPDPQDWKEDGYRLFDRATIEGASDFASLSAGEAGALFCSRPALSRVAGTKENTNHPGEQGSIDSLFLQLQLLAEQRIVLVGEGCFPQIRETQSDEERRSYQAGQALDSCPDASPVVTAAATVVYGTLTEQVLPVLLSSVKGILHGCEFASRSTMDFSTNPAVKGNPS